MSLTVGIDLGTTNSCIAIPKNAEIPGKEELLKSGRLLERGGVLVVTDANRSSITPSVVWIAEDSTPMVGGMAKSKARVDGEPPPAMFFKRTMGTDEQVTAGHARLTSQEASTHVLRYLKELAEEVVEVPIDRAVVTVPAFFETRAKNETVQAAKAAGFTQVETLTESFAAALTSIHDRSPDSPKKFLVYDLGGGTFDVSVVSWSPDIGFEHLAFEGDRYLGGYEFDRALVRWIAEKLPVYDLRLDPAKPADAQLLARLLVHVEYEKHNLSRVMHTEIAIQHEGDRAGTSMSIKQPVSRAEFEDLIGADVRRTLSACIGVLSSAEVAAADLDEIIMVGGSSRVPLVGRMLTAEFGREPRQIDPDLCVAIGAALKAGAAPVRRGILEIDQIETGLPTTDITGRVLPGAEVPEFDRLRIMLRSADGTQLSRQQPDGDGRFIFEEVDLLAGDNEFTLVVTADGEEVDSHQFTVTPDQAPPMVDEGDVLAHYFYVDLATGLYEVAAAGRKLPYQTNFRLQTAGPGVFIRVPLIEGHIPIGEVEILGLPASLPVGTLVEVDLNFRTDWTIEAQLDVPSADRAGHAVITVPSIEVPAWEELLRLYDEVLATWQERKSVALPEDLVRFGPQLARLLEDIDVLLNRGEDAAKTRHRLLQAQTIVGLIRIPSPSGLHPPLSEFEGALDKLMRLCAALDRRDPEQAAQHRDAIPSLRAGGRAAHAADNAMDWDSFNKAVAARIANIEETLAPPPDRPSPANLRHLLLSDLAELDHTLRGAPGTSEGPRHDQAEGFLAEVNAVKQAVSSVDIESPHADERLTSLHHNEIQPLSARIESWRTGRDDGPGRIPLKRKPDPDTRGGHG
jgi:actin-like ATPase involved in cell morphogenesis